MRSLVTTSVAEILCEDTSQIPREDWLELRKLGLGSSDAAPALNQSPWRSQWEVWAEKRGLLPDQPDRWRFRIGREAEPLILSWWAEMFEHDLSELRRHTMVRSTEFPYMIANADADSDELNAVVEVKTSSEFDQKHWDDGVPDQYVIQGLHLMFTYGRPRCIFPVAFGWNPPVEYVLELEDIDKKTIQAMVTIEGELWRRVQENDPPDPDGSESAMMAIREAYLAIEEDKTVELPDTAVGMLKAREADLLLADAASKRADAVKQSLLLMLVKAEAEVGTYLGTKLITYKADKNGKRSVRFPNQRSAA